MKALQITLTTLVAIVASSHTYASDMSWGEILTSQQYKPHSSSYISPAGASLFNVCRYSEGTLKVIDPKPACAEVETVTIGLTKKDAYTYKRCKAYAPVEETFVEDTYQTCEEHAYETTSGPLKDAHTTVSCATFSDPIEIPETQTVAVYKDVKNYSLAFYKDYTIPDCTAVVPVPDKKQ